MISSASISQSQENYNESYFFLKNQIFKGLLPGLFFGALAYFLPCRRLKNAALPFFIIAIIMMLLVFIPSIGVKHGGAQRWIKIGSIVFQPSEIFKLAFIIYLAAWLSNKGKAIKSFTAGLIPFMVLTGLTGLLIILQPDIGTFGIIGLSAAIIYFLAGARLSHVGIIGGGGGAVLFFLSKFYTHVTNRLQVFLHPELDPQGLGYQINQALLAFGSGGLFGLGLGQSLQKFRYLPEPASDSIAAVIGEELGFVGLLCLLAMFLIFAFRGFKIARQSPDDFARLLAGGLTSWIIIQAIINISAICGLIPLTGVTLPFVSLGGSSLVVCLTGTGILLNISKYGKIQ